MPRLVPNPIGDLHKPLQRIESAVAGLADKLRPVDSLPDVHEELLEVNKNLRLVLDALNALRDDLAGLQAAQLDGTVVKPVRPARARGAG